MQISAQHLSRDASTSEGFLKRIFCFVRPGDGRGIKRGSHWTGPCVCHAGAEEPRALTQRQRGNSDLVALWFRGWSQNPHRKPTSRSHSQPGFVDGKQSGCHDPLSLPPQVPPLGWPPCHGHHHHRHGQDARDDHVGAAWPVRQGLQGTPPKVHPGLLSSFLIGVGARGDSCPGALSQS